MPAPKPPAPKMVWRISESAPMGAWVPKVAPVADKPGEDLPEVSYGSWVTSSYDLLDGVQVTEDFDTVPGELFDELFPVNPDAPKKATKK